jgi:uroporphyrinogen decarboxylase
LLFFFSIRNQQSDLPRCKRGIRNFSSTAMTSKERLLRAMNFETPDRVPVMCQLSLGHILLQTKLSPAEFWFSEETFAEGLRRIRELYQFDGILVSLHGHDPDWKKNVVKITKGSEGETVYWKNGDRTLCLYNDLPQHIRAEPQTFPNSASGIDPDIIPERIDFIPVSQGLDFAIHPEHRTDIYRKFVQNTEFSIHGEITSPFDYLLRLIGHRQALVALIDEPERCEAILQRYTDGVKQLALEQAQCGVDAIKVSSPFAGAGFLSPRFYERFVLPYERQIAQAVRAQGVHIYTHTCGAIGDRLELIARTGVSGIECLDPPPIGNVELAEAKARIGKTHFIKGNIDSVNVLLRKTRDEVMDDARQRIQIGMPGSGFILSTACAVAPHVPRENVQALEEAAEEFGGYS